MPVPALSAYMTNWNSLAQGYPIEAALRSLLRFAGEVVVLDAGSRDGSYELLLRLHAEDWRLRVMREALDVHDAGWALTYDLALVQQARAACHGDYLWQAEPFEVVSDGDARKIRYCLDYLDPTTPVLALPSYEYWGSTEWVRRDQYPGTPKLSIRAPWLEHGLPRGFRATDEHGALYALPYASLAASYIDTRSDEPPAYSSVLDDEIEAMREVRVQSDRYEALFHDQLDDLPVVHNFQWYAIDAELRRLRDYWSRFHGSFYRSRAVSAWPFFDKPWSDVSDQDVLLRAVELEVDGPAALGLDIDYPSRMQARMDVPEAVRPWLERSRCSQGSLALC